MATISPAFVTIFDNEVKQAYQASRALAGLVREKSIDGDTVKFNKLGKGVASVRTPQSDVVPMSLAYSLVTATMTDYIAAEILDGPHQSPPESVVYTTISLTHQTASEQFLFGEAQPFEVAGQCIPTFGGVSHTESLGGLSIKTAIGEKYATCLCFRAA